MANEISVEQAQARSFAGSVHEVPDNIEAEARPAPPVGHFGYTEEDAEKVQQENEKAGARVEPQQAIEDSGRGADVTRVEDDTATRDGAIANVAGTGTKRGRARQSERLAAVQQAPAGQSRSGSQPEE
jgi:hypothetical protein